MLTSRLKDPDLKDLRILIVEDEAVVALDLENTFMDHGAGVVCPPVASRQEALAAIEAHRIDFALLDVALRDGDVWPVAERLAARSVPMAFHSGHAARDEIMARFPDAGLVVKPSHPDLLAETVHSVLHRA